jgi:isoleucyl-tRNA synthetase
MSGFDSPYVPGWDCHGLPIEIKVDNELGSKKAQMSAAEIRPTCRKYAAKYVRLAGGRLPAARHPGTLGRLLI